MPRHFCDGCTRLRSEYKKMLSSCYIFFLLDFNWLRKKYLKLCQHILASKQLNTSSSPTGGHLLIARIEPWSATLNLYPSQGLGTQFKWVFSIALASQSRLLGNFFFSISAQMATFSIDLHYFVHTLCRLCPYKLSLLSFLICMYLRGWAVCIAHFTQSG